jgi:DNA mismatch repair protein MutS
MSVAIPNAEALSQLTPMLRQYYELKARAGDAILFFRMGDFFEIFGADAEEVAPILELVLTSRERGDAERIPFCGVPHHSARNYWLKLLRKGFKVALADQIEDPAEAKGLVKRDIVRVLTPGCIDDLEGLDRDAPNYLMALHEEPEAGRWAVVVADVSTGELRLGAMQGLGELKALVERFAPKEILARKFFHEELGTTLAGYLTEQRLLIEALPEAPLRDKVAQKALITEVFGKPTSASQPCGEIAGGDALLAALLTHLRSLQASLSQFLTVKPLVEAGTMVLDETAVRDLEIFETVRRRQTDGSLYREINKTLTPMGARLLRYFLTSPLVDQGQIRGRHAAVRALLKLGESRLLELRAQLKLVPDLERLSTRIFAGSASPMELARASTALTQAQWLVDNLTGDRGDKLGTDLYKVIATGLNFYKRPLKLLGAALVEGPKAIGSGGGVFKVGFDKELDELTALAQSGEAQVEAYQEKLRAETGIGSLKIRHHKAFGLLIEITKANFAKVPASFIRRQTMVNCERFVTLELQDLDQTLASASEKAAARETALYLQLLQELGKFRMDVKSVAHALASVDLLQSFAWMALKHSYCEPKLADDDKLELKGSRHPVVERFVGAQSFVPNDVTMTPQQRHLLITGPNMAGKSTVMRQTALAALLCQIGSYVPAQSAKLPVFDRIFTRVGAADDLSRGQSTFMVEMAEAANILRNATQKSLVILDEVGRGTSTQDGLAIASAILCDLARRVRCMALFATHYHELVPLAGTLPTVRVMQTEVIEQKNRVSFTHRLKDGACDSSYGLEVARIAGLPESVLVDAGEFLRGTSACVILSEAKDPLRDPSAKGLRMTGATANPAPAAATHTVAATELADKLMRANLNRMTPLAALNLLFEWQNRLSAGDKAAPLFERAARVAADDV